jgi:phosphoribosylanthranilate isomerase
VTGAPYSAPLAAGRNGRPVVKICGLTRPEDVALAVRAGAWAVGFVFTESPRRVTRETAAALVATVRKTVRETAEATTRASAGPATAGLGGAETEGRGRAVEVLPAGPIAVGVFGESSPDDIVRVVEATGIDAVQLHGSRPDPAAVRAALGGRGRQVLIIKTMRVPVAGTSAEALEEAAVEARLGADLVLFDTVAAGRSGGTGATFPWELAREAAGDGPYLVAGGLGPHNARRALEVSGAWGVDVSSGVEQSPGIKDGRLVEALFAALARPRTAAAHQ